MATLFDDWLERKYENKAVNNPAKTEQDNNTQKTDSLEQSNNSVKLTEMNGVDNTKKRKSSQKKPSKKVSPAKKKVKKASEDSLKSIKIKLAIGMATALALAGVVWHVASNHNAKPQTTERDTTTQTTTTIRPESYPGYGGVILPEQLGPSESDGYCKHISHSLEDIIEDVKDSSDIVYSKNYTENGKTKTWQTARQNDVFDAAYIAVEKLENDFAEKKKVSANGKGEYIAEWITPEFLTIVCFNESSYRILDDKNKPLTSSSGATGPMQIKDEAAEDILECYSRWSNDEKFAELLDIHRKGQDPRDELFTSLCLSATYYQWMEEEYFVKKGVYEAFNIDRNNMTPEDIEIMQNVASGCYYAGTDGTVKNITKGVYSRADFETKEGDTAQVNGALSYAHRICAKRRVVRQAGLEQSYQKHIDRDGEDCYYME